MPGPQTKAFTNEADILYYGGSPGGGKTWLIMGLALTAHRKSIIFRREFPQLQEIEDTLRELSEGIGTYNSSRHVLRLKGRQIELGAVQLPTSVLKYQGRAHDLIAFDEISHFLEAQFRFLIGWLRSNVKEQRQRVVATGNPPLTPEGEWINKYWGAWLDPMHPRPAEPGELRYYVHISGKDVEVENGNPVKYKDETLKPMSRTFIPASVEDNPYLMATGYKTILQNLPEPLRSKMLYGDYSKSQEDDPWQVIPTAWVDQAMSRWSDQRPSIPLSSLGVDVARGGNDKTTLAPRYGTWFDIVKRFPGAKTPDGPSVAALIRSELNGSNAPANIDIIGVGAAAYDAAKANGINAIPLNGSHGTKAKDRTRQLTFRNKRAEWWWKFREMLDPQYGENIALPPDRELRADLCAPRWKLSVSGIQIEDKEEIKKRIERSPDVGESVIYSSVVEGRMPGDLGIS